MTAPALSIPTPNGRYYQRPGHGAVPSITNIIGKKFKPLFGAGMKEAARYAAESKDRLGGLNEDEVFRLVSNPPRRDDSPAAIGDIVHGWIDRYAKGDRPTGEEVHASHQTAQWMYDRFLRFVSTYKPEFTDSEFTVWSHTHGYAGTADLSFRVAGLHVLADTKTGRAVYPEAGMQVAAISHADVIVDPSGHERSIPKYDRYAILHLRPRSFTLHPVDNIEAAFNAFLALKQVFDWDVEYSGKTIGFAPKHN